MDERQALQEMAAYCRRNIEDFEVRVQLALKRIDRMRCPLSMADEYLHDEIWDCIEEWCDDNGYSIDFFDDLDAEDVIWVC